jgi:Mce-associated membrane protein
VTAPLDGPATPDPRSRLRMNLVLYVVTLLTAAACVVVGVNIYRSAQEDPAPPMPSDGGLKVSSLAEASDEEQERIAEVLDSATGLATAFVNLRHDDLEGTLGAVTERATGQFRKELDSSDAGFRKILQQSRSVTEGEVIWAAVETADKDSARVLVATTGTVANKTTKGKKTARHYRFLLNLVHRDGEWLTNSLEFVS